MNKAQIISAGITAAIFVGAVLYRLLWAGAQVAAGSGFGGLPISRKLRQWLRDEHDHPSSARS